MKKRPLALTIVAMIFVGIAISLPVQALLLQDPRQFPSSMTLLNWMLMLSLLTSAVLLFDARKGARQALLTSITLMLINNYWVGWVETDYSADQTLLGSCLFLAVCMTLLQKESRWVLSRPKQNWWTIPTRKKIQWEVSLSPFNSQKIFSLSTFDASVNGLFIVTEEMTFNEGQRFEILLRTGANQASQLIRGIGELVRTTKASQSHPAGIGLKFTPKDFRDQLLYKKCLDQSL